MHMAIALTPLLGSLVAAQSFTTIVTAPADSQAILLASSAPVIEDPWLSTIVDPSNIIPIALSVAQTTPLAPPLLTPVLDEGPALFPVTDWPATPSWLPQVIPLATDLPIPTISDVTSAPDQCTTGCEIYPWAQCRATWSKWLDTVVVGTAYLHLDADGRYMTQYTDLDPASVSRAASLHKALPTNVAPLVTASKLDEPRYGLIQCSWRGFVYQYPTYASPTPTYLAVRTTDTTAVRATIDYCSTISGCSSLMGCDSLTTLQPGPTAINDPADIYGDAYTLVGFDECLSPASVLAANPSDVALNNLLQTCGFSNCVERPRPTITSSVIALITTTTYWHDDYTATPVSRRSTTITTSLWSTNSPEDMPSIPLQQPSTTVHFSEGRRGSAWQYTAPTPWATYPWVPARTGHYTTASDWYLVGTGWAPTNPVYSCTPAVTPYVEMDQAIRVLSNTTFIIKTVVSTIVGPQEVSYSWSDRPRATPAWWSWLQDVQTGSDAPIVPEATFSEGPARSFCYCGQDVVACDVACSTAAQWSAPIPSEDPDQWFTSTCQGIECSLTGNAQTAWSTPTQGARTTTWTAL